MGIGVVKDDADAADFDVAIGFKIIFAVGIVDVVAVVCLVDDFLVLFVVAFGLDPLGIFVVDPSIDAVIIVTAVVTGPLGTFVNGDGFVVNDDVMVVAVIVVISVVTGPLGTFVGDPTVCDGFIVSLVDVDVVAVPLVVAVVNGTLGTFVVDPAIVKIDPSVTFVNDDFVAVAVLFMATGVVLANVDPHAIVVAFGTSEILFSFKLKSSSRLLLPLI